MRSIDNVSTNARQSEASQRYSLFFSNSCSDIADTQCRERDAMVRVAFLIRFIVSERANERTNVQKAYDIFTQRYIYIHTYTHTHTHDMILFFYIFIERTQERKRVYIEIAGAIYTYVYICIYIYIYTCVYIYIYIRVCIYIYAIYICHIYMCVYKKNTRRYSYARDDEDERDE